MAKTAHNPRRIYRAVLFSIIWSLGIRLSLPCFLDGARSVVILGMIPGMITCLSAGLVLKILRRDERWTGPTAGIFLGGVAILLFSPPPLPVLLTVACAGTATYILEYPRDAVRFLALVPLIIALFVRTEGGRINGTRLLVLGIDAMDYNVVSDLAGAGLLPNIQGLIIRGAFGPFESEEPSFSPILWTTIASGRGREAHGIDGFYNTADQVRTPRAWDILREAGWSIGVYRWLVTWPPHVEPHGFWIPDVIAPDSRAYPPEYGAANEFRAIVRSEMMHRRNYIPVREAAHYGWSILHLGVRGSTLLSLIGECITHARPLRNDPDYRYLMTRKIDMEVNCDLFLKLTNTYQPAFATFYDNSVDMVGHRCWGTGRLDQEGVPPEIIRRYGSDVVTIYRWTDSLIGRIVKAFPAGCHLFLLSDHGQKAMEGGARNSWIILGDHVLEALGIDDKVYEVSLGDFSFLFPIHRESEDKVPGIVSRELQRIRLEDEDVPLFCVRYDSSSHVPYLDLTRRGISGNETITLDGRPVDLSEFTTRYFLKRGTHDRYGVLLLSGPGVRDGVKLNGATLRDFLPTLLYWEGLPVARDMDGKVLLSAFESKRKIRYIDTYGERDMVRGKGDIIIEPSVKQRLKALGYVN